jgi:ABC-2 type transport system permease protein
MTAIAQSYFMTQRHARQLLRQPWFVAITLIQPVIWLVLFGSLFRSVTEIPGFLSVGGTYLDYLVPGIIVMTALMASGWSGMGVIEDIDRGLLDRFLASPTHRSSLIVGRIGYEAIALVIQGLIMGGLAWLLGAQFASGPLGFMVLLGVAVLVAFAFASLSCAMALTLRQRESVIGVNTMLTLPLTFLSAAFMPLALAPDWIETVATYNPINWAVEAGREALVASPDWSFVLPRVGGLAVVALLSVALATRAFHGYQRSA